MASGLSTSFDLVDAAAVLGGGSRWSKAAPMALIR
jgi:hypothetical protein